MAKQITLKIRNEEGVVYPITSINSVVDANGNSLSDRLLPTAVPNKILLTDENGVVKWGTDRIANIQRIVDPDEILIDGNYRNYAIVYQNTTETAPMYFSDDLKNYDLGVEEIEVIFYNYSSDTITQTFPIGTNVRTDAVSVDIPIGSICEVSIRLLGNKFYIKTLNWE
jgi:hypothetical protein